MLSSTIYRVAFNPQLALTPRRDFSITDEDVASITVSEGLVWITNPAGSGVAYPVSFVQSISYRSEV